MEVAPVCHANDLIKTGEFGAVAGPSCKRPLINCDASVERSIADRLAQWSHPPFEISSRHGRTGICP